MTLLQNKTKTSVWGERRIRRAAKYVLLDGVSMHPCPGSKYRIQLPNFAFVREFYFYIFPLIFACHNTAQVSVSNPTVK